MVGIPPTVATRRMRRGLALRLKSSRRKRIAFQCASVSVDADLRGELRWPGPRPIRRAVRKPSSSTWTVGLPIVVDGHGCHHSSVVGWCLPAIDMCAGSGMRAAGQQQVPVQPPERELPQWLTLALRPAGGTDRRRATGTAGQRLGVVVEVDQQRLAVVRSRRSSSRARRSAASSARPRRAQEVVGEHLTREVGHRPGLRGGDVVGVADREDVGVALDSRVCGSTGTG